jgi:hypothetical protein
MHIGVENRRRRRAILVAAARLTHLGAEEIVPALLGEDHDGDQEKGDHGHGDGDERLVRLAYGRRSPAR